MHAHDLADEPTQEDRSFHARLSLLEAAIPGAAREAQPLLTNVHRAVRTLHDRLQRIDVAPILPRTVNSRIRCFDCGATGMDTFHTSTQGGYHLCLACFQHRLQTGRAKTAH